MTGKVISKCFK